MSKEIIDIRFEAAIREIIEEAHFALKKELKVGYAIMKNYGVRKTRNFICQR